MGAAYSQDLRDRVLAAYDRGMMTRQISEVFAISPAWARRVKQRRRECGQCSPLPMGGVRIVKIDLQALRALVAAQPDATTRQLHQRLLEAGTRCCESAVGLALKRLGLSFKKRRSMPPSRIEKMSPRSGRRGNASNPDVVRSA